MQTYTENGFTYAILTAEQIAFLKGYTPKDAHFTSKEEMDMIKDALGIENGMSMITITAIRNSVVWVYDNWMYAKDGFGERVRTEGFWDYMKGMQSVTATIDCVKYI